MTKEGISLGNRLRRHFIAGIVIFLPLALTVNLFILTISFADGILGRYIEPYFSREFGFYFRGVSILVTFFVVFIIGFLANNFFGRRIYHYFEGLLTRIPFFKQVYPAIKEISLFFFSDEKKISFERVVVVEWPRHGVYAIGFLTNDSPKKICEKTSQDLCSVFIPHTPTPLTGFLTMIPRKDIIFPEMGVEEALKIIVSGGVVGRDF